MKKGTEWWIGEGDLGRRRGGHAVCIYKASDTRQAFGFVNNWGTRYPVAWLPYGVAELMLTEHA